MPRPSSISASGTFTYEIWAKFKSGDTVGGGAHIFGSNARNDGLLRSANGFNVNLTIDGSGNLKTATFNGGGTADIDSGLDISTGDYFQVGMMQTATTNSQAFKNGAVGTLNTRWSTQSFSYMTIGGEHNEGGNFLQCDFPKIIVYSVKLYNRLLTRAELLQNYNALKGRFGL